MNVIGTARAIEGLRQGLRLRRAVPLALAALLLGGCRTQLWPKPMVDVYDPLPAGVDSNTPAGLVEVLVYRHADPVQVRRPESPTAFPLTFYRKQRRMSSGAWVHCGAGGRAEILWPADGAKVVLFDDGVVRVGEPTRGEPALRFESLTRAEIELSPGSVVELPGGSQLIGPPNAATGPYLVQQIYSELLRIFNQSAEPVYIAFREAEITLAPGERIDLPLLGAGGSPIDLGGPPREVRGGRIDGVAYGELDVGEEAGGLLVRAAAGRGVVLARGVAVRLRPGEAALFTDLGGPDAAAPPEPESGLAAAAPASDGGAPR